MQGLDPVPRFLRFPGTLFLIGTCLKYTIVYQKSQAQQQMELKAKKERTPWLSRCPRILFYEDRSSSQYAPDQEA